MIVNVPPSFTLDELLAHLRAEEPELAEGYYSAAEWASRFDVSLKRMRDVLREAKAQGKLLCKRTLRERVDGTRGMVPLYAFDLTDGDAPGEGPGDE